jgi:hypothetical protein
MKKEVFYSSNNGGQKTIINYQNNVSVQVVEGYPYTNGLVDVHITINGSSSTNGANFNDELNLSESIKSILDMFGARSTKKHIRYGKCYVDKKSALAKTRDMMALAEIISEVK